MTASTPGGSRRLAGLEHAMRYTDDVAPFNVVLVVQIEGDLPGWRLKEALEQLQRRHPLLQACIAREGKGYSFRFGASGPIPLEEGEPSAVVDWVATAESELHRRFNLETGPLMRCRQLRFESGGCVIITLHHTIVDAASAMHLTGELVSLCAGRALDGVDTGNEGRVPAVALYPARFNGLGFARAAGAYMARQMADEMKFRWRSRGVRKAPIAAAGRCRLLPIRFSPELSAALLQASRRHRITVNSILSAGVMSAVQRRLYPSPRVPLRHIVFTDLRPHLRETVPAGVLGCHLSMLRFTVVVESGGDFWQLARDVQETTLRAARAGERFLSYSMSPKMMEMILGIKAFRMAATALSYTGPVELPAADGSFAATGLHAFTTNITLGPEFSALVRLFRGELWWDILYLDSDMDAKQACEIAREMRAILESAAC